MAEVRGFFKYTLFVRMRNNMPQTNGFYAVKARDVINSGQEFVKNVQSQKHQGFNLGNLDRKNKDKKLSKAYVVITEG